MNSKKERPYTENRNRLADVIAAIQVMAVYKFYKRSFAGWADRICGDEAQGDYWKEIFQEHPEFFRIDSTGKNASLVWRRSHQKLYDVDKEHQISREEYRELSPDQKARISRAPLTNADISALVGTAINLHSREIEHKKDSRWWITAAFGLAGVIIGAVLNGISG